MCLQGGPKKVDTHTVSRVSAFLGHPLQRNITSDVKAFVRYEISVIFNLPHHTQSPLNCFWTRQGPRLAKSGICEYSQEQTMNHIADTYSLTEIRKQSLYEAAYASDMQSLISFFVDSGVSLPSMS